MIKHIIVLFFMCFAVCYSQDINKKAKISSKSFFNNTTSKEYLFIWPMEMETDSEGNVYILDIKAYEIRKYSKDGKYLLSIGRTGNGPGEFQDISDICINSHNLLYVLDKVLRRISVFNKNGKLIDTIILKSGLNLSEIAAYRDNEVLLIHYSMNSYDEIINKYSISDNKLNNIKTTFGHSSIFWDFSKIETDNISLEKSLNQIIMPDGSIFAVKRYYDGKLFHFNSKNQYKNNIFKSNNKKIRNYRITTSRANFPPSKGTNMLYFGSRKTNQKVAMQIYATSAGLFIHNNKYIVNFLYLVNSQSKMEFGCELFDLNGNYLGYTMLSSSDANLIMSVHDKVYCQDSKGCFYYLERNPKDYAVCKFTLTVN